MNNIKKELYSFSKLTTFHTCPYSYYLTYIKKEKRKDNVYSYLGGKIHSLLEDLQQNKINNQKAISLFLSYFDDADILGYDFPTENSSKNFKECMVSYFENYKPFSVQDFKIEEYFEVDIEGVPIRGYIDLYTITDNKYIDIYDYKSSSKFTKKDLEIKKLQLIIYGLALKNKYPNMIVRSLNFDMCKYTKNSRGTIIERNKSNEYTGRALVEIPFTEENINKAKEFVFDTYKKINNNNEEESSWIPYINKFFCKNICSHYKICPHLKF